MIKVQQLEFSYAGAAQPAIRQLGFEVARGEIFGFLGPSGAGKSTTQRVLTGLLGPYQGQVEVMGRELDQWGAEFYEQIGVSFELPNHFLKLTGLENLNYFGALYRSEGIDPKSLLDSVGLLEDADTRVGKYSKGMMTRLGVARALLHDPTLLFMDEPTAGLDPVTARMIKRLVREQRDQGKTVFLTTHDMTAVDELCDRVAFIVGGEIKVMEQPRQLKLRYGSDQVVVEYLGSGGRQRQSFSLDGLGSDPGFIEILRNQKVQTIHTQEASLEEVFVKVTGERLA